MRVRPGTCWGQLCCQQSGLQPAADWPLGGVRAADPRAARRRQVGLLQSEPRPGPAPHLAGRVRRGAETAGPGAAAESTILPRLRLAVAGRACPVGGPRRGGRRGDRRGAARQRAALIVAELERLAAMRAPQVRYPTVTGNLLLARAEQSRLEGRSDPERWQTAATAWERLEHPFDAAYARFRQAEALLARGGSRQKAEQAIRRAHRTAVALGAAPLRREVELLAQRGRLSLEEPEDTTASPEVRPSPATSLGLTRREVEVLALVAQGRTNRQIGQALFITPQTASVHVSRILAKLGVTGRGEAAAIAHRLGLDKQ